MGRKRGAKKKKKKKTVVSTALSRASNLNDVIHRLSKIKNVKLRNKMLRQSNDHLIRDLSPRIRKRLKYISPLLSSKGHSSLTKFISCKTPIAIRRQMLRGQSGGGVGSWFTHLIGSIIPLLGAII